MSKVEEHESVNNLKRKFPVAKPQLKETNSNIPSPHKRAKIESPGKQQSTQQPQQQPQPQPQPQPQQEKATHKPKKSSHQLKNNDKLAGDEMHEWQQSWRRIMKSSIVYFEGDQQLLEYRKAHKLLRLVGCKVTPFMTTM